MATIDHIKSEDEFRMLWDLLLTVARTAQYLPVEDVQKMLNTVSMSHAIGAIIEPTKYRDGGMDNLEEQEVLLNGFLAFRKAIEKVRELGAERSPKED